ncbi:hypothetical protein D3C72_1852900 [compost metagenome]
MNNVVGTCRFFSSWTTGWLNTMSEVNAWLQATCCLPGPSYMPDCMRAHGSYAGFHLPS